MKRLGIDFGSSYIKCADVNSGKLISLGKRAGGESLNKLPNQITYYGDGKTRLGAVPYQMKKQDEYAEAVTISSIKTRLSDHTWQQKISGQKTLNASQVTKDIMCCLYDIIHAKNTREDDYRVTVTVPVCFSERQRQIISRSAQSAGFQVESVISEPFASLFYLMRDNLDEHHNVLVIDIGGGTLDVCLVAIQGNKEPAEIKTESTAGINFGGISINNSIIDEYLLKRYQTELNPILGDAAEPLAAVKKRAELFEDVDTVKEAIFHEDFDDDELDEPQDLFISSNDASFDMEITASDVYQLLEKHHIKSRLYDLLDTVIDDSSMVWANVTDIFITGGSSMIPYFRNTVTDYLHENGIEDTDSLFALYEELELEEQAVGSVALGAGIYNKLSASENADLLIKDKIPFTIFTKDLSGNRVTRLKADCAYQSYRSVEFALSRIHPEKIEVYQIMPDESGDEVSLGAIAIENWILEQCTMYRLGIDKDRRVYAEFGVIEGNKMDAAFRVIGEKKYLEIDI